MGDYDVLCRPCVDCGKRTGRYCDRCFAADRLPKEVWAAGQRTPLCTSCDNEYDECHFCRGLHWVVRPPFDPADPSYRGFQPAGCGFQPAGDGRGDHPQPRSSMQFAASHRATQAAAAAGDGRGDHPQPGGAPFSEPPQKSGGGAPFSKPSRKSGGGAPFSKPSQKSGGGAPFSKPSQKPGAMPPISEAAQECDDWVVI